MAHESALQMEQAFADLRMQILDIIEDVNKLRTFNGLSMNRVGLTQSIHEEIKNTGMQLDRLKIEATRYGDRFSNIVKDEQKAFDRLKSQFRQSVIKAEKNKHKQLKNDREMLLAGAVSPAELRKWRARDGDELVGTSNEITSTLRETVQIMEGELKKSHANISTLQESSRMLTESKKRHELLDDVMRVSRGLILKLERADWTDRMLMLFAFLFFVGVVLNIIRRRVWIPGSSLLFRWFKALVFGGIESNGAKVETSIVSDAISSTSSALILGAATVLTTATHGVSLENIPQGRPEDLQPNRHELTSIEKISDINTLLVDTIESEYINQDAQSETLIQEPPQKTAHKEDTSSSNTSKKKKPKRTKSPTKATPRSTQKSANHQESVDPGPPKPPKPSLHAEHVEL